MCTKQFLQQWMVTVTQNATQVSCVVGGSAAQALTQGKSTCSTLSLIIPVGAHSKQH